MNELNRYSNALRQTHSAVGGGRTKVLCLPAPPREVRYRMLALFFLSLSRGKCVFIVFDDGMLIISGRVYVFLVLLSENTLQIPAEWNILYWSSFLGRGKAGGKRTDWRDFSVFVNLQIG